MDVTRGKRVAHLAMVYTISAWTNLGHVQWVLVIQGKLPCDGNRLQIHQYGDRDSGYHHRAEINTMVVEVVTDLWDAETVEPGWHL